MSIPDDDIPDPEDIPGPEDYLRDRSPDREQVEEDFKRTLLTGAAITVPLIITLLVLLLVLDFIAGLLTPVVDVLNGVGITSGIGDVLVQVLALATLFGVVFAMGAIAERRPEDSDIATSFDAAMERIPGVGSVYTSVNRMSEVLLESDTQSFQEVKLLEFPHRETYALTFLTAEAPQEIEAAAGHEGMLTLFVPLAPNPFMGGHLVTVPDERVHDVDMTIEEGVQAVVTTGVAVDESVGATA